jgi:hypothetical protein
MSENKKKLTKREKRLKKTRGEINDFATRISQEKSVASEGAEHQNRVCSKCRKLLSPCKLATYDLMKFAPLELL